MVYAILNVDMDHGCVYNMICKREWLYLLEFFFKVHALRAVFRNGMYVYGLFFITYKKYMLQ